MTYKIVFKKSAEKEFLKLPKEIIEKFKEIFAVLSINPYSEILDIKKLKNVESLYRVRVGQYRMIYVLEKGNLKVLIIKVGHRKEVYDRL